MSPGQYIFPDNTFFYRSPVKIVIMRFCCTGLEHAVKPVYIKLWRIEFCPIWNHIRDFPYNFLWLVHKSHILVQKRHWLFSRAPLRSHPSKASIQGRQSTFPLYLHFKSEEKSNHQWEKGSQVTWRQIKRNFWPTRALQFSNLGCTGKEIGYFELW